MKRELDPAVERAAAILGVRPQMQDDGAVILYVPPSGVPSAIPGMTAEEFTAWAEFAFLNAQRVADWLAAVCMREVSQASVYAWRTGRRGIPLDVRRAILTHHGSWV